MSQVISQKTVNRKSASGKYNSSNPEECRFRASDRQDFGVYAADLLSRWRALRGFRKTLEDDHD